MGKRKKYEERLVVYLDILGFAKLIEQSFDEKTNLINTEILNNIHKIHEDIGFYFQERYKGKKTWFTDTQKSRKITHFSDSIVISYKANAEDAVFYCLIDIQLFVMSLINKGLLLRGAFAKGKLIHTSNHVFGPALVDAYYSESKAAFYPRIILGKEIIDLAYKYKGDNPTEIIKNILNNLLIKDSDGMYYLDYFMNIQENFDYPLIDYVIYLAELRNIIRNGLASKDHSINIKYKWLKEKFNKTLSRIQTPGNYKIIQMEEGVEIVESYKILKPFL